jgi:hypothetical protein
MYSILTLLIFLSVGSEALFEPSEYLDDNEKFLENWMGALSPILKDLTMLDIAIPGTHDTMTYDLSTTVSDGANDISVELASILHDLHKEGTVLTIGDFGRNQSQSQGLNVTRQLMNGIRYLDFRITFTAPPDKESFRHELFDWYCLHFMQSDNISMDYLKEIHDFLVSHPTEIIVILFSWHGGVCNVSYPIATQQDMLNFWNSVVNLFSGMMFDTRKSQMNTTSIGELIKTNQRFIVYTSDYETFTNNSVFAMDGCLIDNVISGSYYDYFTTANKTTATNKKKNMFSLLQMGANVPDGQILYAAEVIYDPFQREEAEKKCAESFAIPNMTEWCPLTLLAISQLTNYYSQKSLDLVISEQLSFPNAIYIDGVDEQGSIRTGTGLSGFFQHSRHIQKEYFLETDTESEEHLETRFCYVDTLLLWNVQKICSMKNVPECKSLEELLEKRRMVNPFQVWYDPYYGRLDSDWPPI